MDSEQRVCDGMEKGISLVERGASRGGSELRTSAVKSCWRKKGILDCVKAGRRPCSV